MRYLFSTTYFSSTSDYNKPIKKCKKGNESFSATFVSTISKPFSDDSKNIAINRCDRVNKSSSSKIHKYLRTFKQSLLSI